MSYNYELSLNEQSERNNEIKKVSKVLHCRNIPIDITEQELVAFASHFGRVTNVLILKGKSQAFIQMESERAAEELFNYHSSMQATIRGKPFYIQYSTRDEITVVNDSVPSQLSDPQSSILLVTVLNVQYPITIEVLHRVFSKFGLILKIVIFSKNGIFQSFIQYANVSSAVKAKELDGQNIYAGCCTLRIQSSNLSNLNVKYNSEKCRDFTNPNLPSDPTQGLIPIFGDPNPVGPYWGTPSSPSSHSMHSNSSNFSPYFKPPPQMVNSGNCVLIASGITPETTPDQLFILFGVYGDVVRVKILYNKKDTALLQFTTPHQATTALLHLDGLPFRGGRLKVSYSRHRSISLPKSNELMDTEDYTKDYTNSPLHRYKIVGSKNFQHITAPSSVLHLSNIPPSLDENGLGNLFNRFGNLIAVKFFTKDRRMALIEYSNIQEAVEALMAMHNYAVGDQNIRVSFSKTSITNSNNNNNNNNNNHH